MERSFTNSSTLSLEKIPPIVQTDQLLVESENVPTAVLHYTSVLHQLFEKIVFSSTINYIL